MMFMVLFRLKQRINIFLHSYVNIFYLLLIDISTDEFPVNYFDRHAIYFKNHDMNNNPLRKQGLCLL
jgi:hypothetical protein